MKTTNIFHVLLLSLLLIACFKSDSNNDEPIDLSIYTYVPDDNFEQLLIDRGYDDKFDDYVLTDNIKSVKELRAIKSIDWGWVTGYSIADFTGLEAFESLEDFTCQNNLITSLDLSKNIALKALNCSLNQLTSLNLSQNTSLETLNCEQNQLTSLDLSQNINLVHLEVVEYTGNYGNNIASLDLSNNKELVRLHCDSNNLSSIDISQNTKLKYFTCTNNELTNLDLSNNIELYHFIGSNNLMTCIKVNQNQFNSINYSGNIQNWHKDPEAIYSLDCN